MRVDRGDGRYTLQRTITENLKHIFTVKFARPQSQFPHSCVCERFIYSQDRSALFCCRKYVDRSREYKIAHRHMNVEIGTEAVQIPEKEYINGIFVAVRMTCETYETFERE